MIKRLKQIPLALFALAIACEFMTGGAQGRQNQTFKNLQELKGLSPDQVLLLMGGYNLALGQNCDFCHDMTAPEKGEKREHKSALQMIKMTREINLAIKDYKLSVDCMSCHQGKAKPPIAKDPGPTPPPAPPNPEPRPMGPEIIIFEAKTLGASKLTFPHAKHFELVSNDCSKCHHTGDIGKCGTCHKHNNGSVGLSFMNVGHSSQARGCFGCHKQSHKGPAQCAECHKK